MSTLLVLVAALVLIAVAAMTSSLCRAGESSEWLVMDNGDVLCARCPTCGITEEHSCYPYVVGAVVLAREQARRKLWLETPESDICGFCQTALAVADTQGEHSAPICTECTNVWTTQYPEKAPCIPRKAS